jgi:hypothetical protein
LEREREVLRRDQRALGHLVNEIGEVGIKPKKQISMSISFGVAWALYIMQAGDETFELPAFGAE